jgi:hypothetical protein
MATETLSTPVISGTTQEGSTLTATAAVANDSDATVSYQWQANHGSSFVNLTGETALTHVLTEADEGATLRIVATSSDSDGSGTTATSAATASITDIAPSLTTPVISGTTQEGSSHATVFDVSADFSLASNPNGVWTYGSETTLGGPLTLYTISGTSSGLQVWSNNAGGLPPPT